MSAVRRKKGRKKKWRCRGLNPGPLTCEASALPLSYIPNMDIECQMYTFKGELTYSGVSCYDQHYKFGAVSRQPKYSRSEVFLVACQIDKGDDFARYFTDVLGTLTLGIVNALKKKEWFNVSVCNCPMHICQSCTKQYCPPLPCCRTQGSPG